MRATCFLLTALLLSFASADDWPQFLGPQRDGVWREDGIVDKFPEDGPPLVWKTAIAAGFSGPAVADGKVYVMDRQAEPVAPKDRDAWKRAEIPGNERVVCLDAMTGEILWTHDYDCPYTTATAYATGPRATPTVDGELVYTLGAEGQLFALNAEDGAVKWALDFRERYGLEIPVWGMASHPLVIDDKLICMAGGKHASVVALNKTTGDEIWRALDSDQPGYAPPVQLTISGKSTLVVWNSDTIAGLDPDNGKTRWSTTVKADFAMAIAAPRLEGNRLFLTYHRGKSAMVDISPNGDSAEVAWLGDLKTGVGGVMSTPWLKDGLIFGCAINGELTCADLATGKKLWETFAPFQTDRRVDWGNLFIVPHEDRYFLASDTGDLIIAKLNAEGYHEIDRANLIEPNTPIGNRKLVWSHPAFAERRIFLRNDSEIRCYSLEKASPDS